MSPGHPQAFFCPSRAHYIHPIPRSSRARSPTTPLFPVDLTAAARPTASRAPLCIPPAPAAGRGRLPKVRYLLTALTDGSVAPPPPPLPLPLPSPEAPAGIESETRAGRIAGLPEGLGTQSGHVCIHVQGAESSDDKGGRCPTTRRRTLMSFIELNIFVLNSFARRRGLILLFDIPT